MALNHSNKPPTPFHNVIETVAIIGGGGQVGQHLLKALLDQGTFTVTAIQRPESTSTLPGGVRIVKASYGGDDNSDDSELVEALRGQQALIVTMAVTAPRDTTLRICRAAATAGVAFVQPNWYGHDDGNESLCTDSMLARTRDALKAEFTSFANTAYIFLVSGFWYEFSLAGGPDRFGFDFKNRSLTWFDDGNVKINTSTWPQSGRALANALSLKILPDSPSDTSPTLSQFGNRSIYISSFRISQRDMYESVKRVTGTTDADWKMSHQSAKLRWEDSMDEIKKGNHGAFTKMLYARMFFPNGDADFETLHGTDNEVLGLPVDDLDDFTKLAVGMGERGEIASSH